MKKTIFLLAMITAIASCGSNDNKMATNENKSADPSTNPDYQKGLALVSKSDCFTCHKVADASTGPAYTAVAKRYAGKPGIEDTLALKIMKGGSGNWGTVPMVGHPQISEDDAKAMAKYVLTLNQ
ncbi:MAG: c-type cytochrome [Bacteroidota bacterium]|nr:c-type cytochrome [Bacteroidota bacterium]